MKSVTALAEDLHVPALHDLLRCFLQAQIYPDVDEPGVDVPLEHCPWISQAAQIAIHHSARATFYSSSELDLPGRMHSEMIWCSPHWYGLAPCRDTVLVQIGPEDDILHGMAVGRVRALLSSSHGLVHYDCALLEWFNVVAPHPDAVTGMWVLEPERHGNHRAIDLVHVDSIIRACHLIPVFGEEEVDPDITFANSLDAYACFYLNPYIDYHMHELLCSFHP